MHPIERLRFVARSRGAPPDVLVMESAAALMAFRDDPAGMVAACRRIIDRQLDCGPLWWLCARMLCGPDAAYEARDAVELFDADPTEQRLVEALDALGSEESVPLLVPMLAGGPDRVLIDADDAADARHAAERGRPVWWVGGVGRVLPAEMFDALERRRDERDDALDARNEVVSIDLAVAVAGPRGVLPPAKATRRPDCPVAPELFRLAG